MFGLAKSDRQYYETKWVANHLQYRGKYDNTVTLLPGRSRVYPRDTRVKVEGFVAKDDGTDVPGVGEQLYVPAIACA